MNRLHNVEPGPERVLLLGVDDNPGGDLSVDESLGELGLLVKTWGGEVVGSLSQVRQRPDAALYVGRGKLGEVGEAARETRATCLAADSELTPVQLRNMEKELDLRVLDRTQIILEIFARRARTREGKLQVELAQSVYALPRLAGKGLILSRLGGGIGTRGPGETKLEADRRRLKDRIATLRRELVDIGRRREVQAGLRRGARVPLVSLVGYTNAGKSSLFGRLTGASVLVEDMLFATLDPVIRRHVLPNGQAVLVSDTVGFIRKLPHHLVAAFRGTLEEVREADVLIHVVDVSSPTWPVQVGSVTGVLEEIGAGMTPVIYALNKIDRLSGGREEALSGPEARRLSREAAVVTVSAMSGEGLEGLHEALVSVLASRLRLFHFVVPYGEEAILAGLHQTGRVCREEYTSEGVTVEVEMEEIAGLRLRTALLKRAAARRGHRDRGETTLGPGRKDDRP